LLCYDILSFLTIFSNRFFAIEEQLSYPHTNLYLYTVIDKSADSQYMT